MSYVPDLQANMHAENQSELKLNLLLTFLHGFLVFLTFYLFKNDHETTGIILILLCICGTAIYFIKFGARFILNYISKRIVSDPLSEEISMQKAVDQSWQLVIHLFGSIMEFKILQSKNFDWIFKPKMLLTSPPYWKHVHTSEIRYFYIFQLATWLVTAFSHRLFEKKYARKDYHVMYVHHLVTIGLILGSLHESCLRVGLCVMFLHDSSDVVIDLMKIFNYLKLEGFSGYFLTEITFILNFITWGYTRLYLFPKYIIYHGTFTANMQSMENLDGSPSLAYIINNTRSPNYKHTLDANSISYYIHVFGPTMTTLLCVLCLMHVYWYCLLLKLFFKIFFSGKSPHTAAGEEYELPPVSPLLLVEEQYVDEDEQGEDSTEPFPEPIVMEEVYCTNNITTRTFNNYQHIQFVETDGSVVKGMNDNDTITKTAKSSSSSTARLMQDESTTSIRKDDVTHMKME